MNKLAMILTVALVAPVSSKAQAPSPAGVGPAERVLAHRAELALSAEQVQKLEAIDRKYDQQDKDVVAKLEALRGKALGEQVRMRDLAAADREKLQAQRAELRPLMQQLRNSHLAAIEEVKGVLTADQNSKAAQYLRQGQGRGPVAGARGQGQGRGPGAMRGRGPGGNDGAFMRGRGNMQHGGRGMMRQGPGAGQGFRGGQAGPAAR